AVRQQCQEPRTLHCRGQLALVTGVGTGDAAGNDLAGFGDVLLQRGEVLVVDVLDALGREAAELAAAEKLGRVRVPSPLFARAWHQGTSSRSLRTLRSS